MKTLKTGKLILIIASAVTLLTGSVVSYANDWLGDLESSGVDRGVEYKAVDTASGGSATASGSTVSQMAQLAVSDVQSLSIQQELYNGGSFQLARYDTGQSSEPQNSSDSDDYEEVGMMAIPICP